MKLAGDKIIHAFNTVHK